MIQSVGPGAHSATSFRRLADLVIRTGRKAASRIFASASAASRDCTRGMRGMEPLESRQLLAGVTFSDGILRVSGSDTAATTLSVLPSGSSSVIAKSGSISKTVAKSSITKIEIYGGSSGDTVRIDGTLNIRSYIDVRGGNDYVSGGGGADEVWGDTGNDTVYGNGGDDSIAGEDGNDLLDGGSGNNTIAGGSGSNVIKNGTSTSSISSTTSSASISGLELWNADTDKKIQNITSGSTLDLATLPSKLTFVAQGTGASVKFALDSNSSYRIENGKPWAIAGDSSGNLASWPVPTGSHTIKLTPYSKDNATGTAGTTKTFTVNFTKSSTSSSSTTTPTTPSTPSTSGIVPRDASAASPNAIISAVSAKTIHAGQSFHANAMSSGLGNGTPLTARYVWDFGDSGSRFNTMVGFNAAHVYEDAGSYTVKLTLTNEAGKTDSATTTVTVQSAGRKVYYVSNSGSDSAAGTSESAPLKTFAKARSKLADNVEILFKGGETFDVKDSITIYRNNVLIGSYGSGKATLRFSGSKDYTSIFYLGGQGHGERTVENLVFDSIYTSGTDQSGMPQAVGAAGKGDAIVNNEFRNVGYAINAQSNPDGLLVQDNNAPLKSGIREYFVWGEGKDFTIQGNNVVNSVFAHIIRIAGVDRINVSNNTFANPTDSADGNTIRGVVTIHQGNYAYVANNTLSGGPTAVGPLGRDTGVAEKSARFHWSVFEGNTFNSQFLLLHGSEHNMVRNNVLNADNTWAIELEAYDANYGRGVVDTTIVNNTAVNDGTTGNFLRVLGESSGINLINNLYIAPKLVVGDTSSGGVLVFDNDLSSFNKITGNVWPVPTATKYAEGGYNYVWSNWSDSRGYKTPAEWAAYGAVINDYFSDVAYSGATPSSSSVAANAGTVWAGVFTDKNGKIRSNGGSWTAGAIEV